MIALREILGRPLDAKDLLQIAAKNPEWIADDETI
jgi:hypothetical protein